MTDLLKHLRKYLAKTKNDWNYITPTEFYKKYYNNKAKLDKYMLIDVRQESEFKKYHIKGAKNIFWLDLLRDENLKKLPKNKKIFIICYVGHTSSQAMTLLKLLGYDVTSIKFGYGVTPVKGVPVAGWTNFKYDVVP